MGMSAHLPQYKVTLYKAIKRTTTDGSMPTSARFQGTSNVIDLTAWLTDTSAVTTSKSVRQPAGGFSITVPDMPYGTGLGLDSLYGVVEPMDLIEIRFRHVVGTADTAALPVVMRGFVSEVNRDESISPDGKPVRSVTINGQDYGKIWQMIQIFYGPGYVIGEDILSRYKLLEKFGAGYINALTNKTFMQVAIDEIVNPFLQGLLPDGCGFPTITLQTDHVKEGAVGISGGIQDQEGTLYNLLRTYLDVGPFNELFLAEDDNGVYCQYRQNPAIGVNGVMLQPLITDQPSITATGADKLLLIDVADADILQLRVKRSDQAVANYYWVQADTWNLTSDIVARQMGYASADRSSIDLTAYSNCAESLYGMRMMTVSTMLGDASITNTKSGLTAGEQQTRDGALDTWFRDRRQFLVAQNKDNALLESGQMRIKGNEKIRPGNYVRIRRGTFEAVYYVAAVTHQILPFRGIYTTLTLERGLGFAARIQASGSSSPYLNELAGIGAAA